MRAKSSTKVKSRPSVAPTKTKASAKAKTAKTKASAKTKTAKTKASAKTAKTKASAKAKSAKTKASAKTKTAKTKASAKTKTAKSKASVKTKASANVIQRWRALDALAQRRGLGWALHYLPSALRYARDVDNARGAAIAPLLPDDYRAFVESVGYPAFGLSYYDREGISFLPPSGIEHISPIVFDREGNEPRRSKSGPTTCFGAFFAGYELSDVEGFAFAPNDAGEIVVWSVEGAMLRDELGSFTTWMGEQIGALERAVKKLSDRQIRSLEEENDGEDDPHRAIDYSLEKSYEVAPYSKGDLRLHWVEDQGTTPYRYGLIDDDGRWVIPMAKRWLSVRPFRSGVAEVIMKDAEDGYGGPWTKIGLDGAPVSTRRSAKGSS